LCSRTHQLNGVLLYFKTSFWMVILKLLGFLVAFIFLIL
jgi:hypothetical protein